LINNGRMVVMMPACNTEQTVLADDHSTDATAEAARRLRLTVEVHGANRGYRRNQKTRYAHAIAALVARR